MEPKGARGAESGPIRVVIVDDHPLVRHGLGHLIAAEEDMEVVGDASGSTDALRLVREQKPNCVVIDLSLQEGTGIELIKQIKALDKNIRMLVFSMHDEVLFAERVLRAGAMGYVNKQVSTEKVVDGIRHIMKGKIFLSEEMSERLLIGMTGREVVGETPVDNLSNRELEIFQLIGQGLSTRKIAEQLHLSSKTVESHRESIKKKLNLSSNLEMIRLAVQFVLEQG
ncbi:MAG TPA: response regulator transcription factor [Candidatus Sumerlaeota bacterium]|nr:MAG: Virulence factors putative positive transcription regulator BvgA [candidate division BRC1 bacterium ADurb.BinA292]HOE96650.1 response regulator transcription factor [Candidatus Sumerlaeota bacterium]HOR27887.1 response regulator transcription factor [Candidatus Sumerlaeota bacterium]HPK01032.1 response regulator transcription factor [Candidatus Sumerlaeota bacterium]